MNIYKKIKDLLPEALKKDLFFKKDLADNGLSYYSSSFERDRKISLADKFFLESHRIFKALSLFANLLDRKMARLQVGLLRQASSADPLLVANKEFHNKHQGKRCFIVANGPSLAKQDLSLLANEFTIATNTIWRHPQLDKWQPTYYCTAHVERFYEKQQLAAGFESASIDDMLDYFKQTRDKLTKAEYFIPWSGLEANQIYNFLPSERTHYLPFLQYPVFELLPNWPDLSLGLPSPQDSSQYAIMIAMAMGFSEIILLGCDHDWFINLGEEKHFFAEPTFKSSKEKYDSTKQPLIDNLFFAYLLWKGHFHLKHQAESRGVKIVNATGGGVLDVYPLARYEDYFNQK